MLGSLGEVLPYAAPRFGDRRALVTGEGSLSFAELDALSSALAASLADRGVGPGDRVTLYVPNSWEWIVSYYGALRTGAVINPVNVMTNPDSGTAQRTAAGHRARVRGDARARRHRDRRRDFRQLPSVRRSNADA